MDAAASRIEPKQFNLNTVKGLFALLLVHTIGPQTIIILPGLVQGYVEQLGYSEQDAGFLASVETWGMFLATFAMMALISRVDWRKLIAASLVAMIGANAASIFADNVAVLYVLRFIAGIGGGAIVAVSYAMIGLTLRKNRNFGWALFFVLLYGAIVFPAMPIVYARFGIDGAFFFFAAFAVCGLPIVRGLPGHGRLVSEGDPDAVELPVTLKSMAVVTMVLYFIGQIGVWSYFYRFGIRYGMSEQAVGSALSISQFFGIAGALSVVVFSQFVRKDIALFLGIGISTISIAFLFGTHAFLAFVIISGVYQFVWNMTHPYLLGALATFDPSGRVIVYGTAMQFLGVAVGPAIAAVLVTEASLDNVLWLGIITMIASIACILPPVITEQRLSKQKIGAS
ncbi:MAG: MFS transporter [Chromatiales bacterium]|nr:MAG: MFS transporter [Chromatiales bacterium]